jgi:hypothetical protein
MPGGHPVTDSNTDPPTTSVRMVQIADLLVVPDYQIRRKTDASTVARYAGLLRAGTVLPPVKAGLISGALVLLDGYHRIEAHRRVNLGQIAVEIVSTTAREAKWLAAEANMAHGLPLKRSEMRAAFRAFIHARRHLDSRGHLLSLREMAKACGVGSHNTVLAWLTKDFPKIARQLQSESPRGGGCYPSEGRSFAQIAREGIAAAVAAARGVTCEFARGALLQAMGEAMDVIEKGTPVALGEPPSPEDDDIVPAF